MILVPLNKFPLHVFYSQCHAILIPGILFPIICVSHTSRFANHLSGASCRAAFVSRILHTHAIPVPTVYKEFQGSYQLPSLTNTPEMPASKTIKLNTGAEMPTLGLGERFLDS